ncbi:oxidoreductase family protein [Nocardia farcinica]|uniref:oxidoreductase family protein n=2 Tax=Nocardia TaxID=1817 RepID=UPI0024556192|nr:oxidoreductase family protein [Nocardia farcinica]
MARTVVKWLLTCGESPHQIADLAFSSGGVRGSSPLNSSRQSERQPTHDKDSDSAIVTAVDWQTLGLALPARDLSFFIGTSLDPDRRRAHEQALVEEYHRTLRAIGVTDYSLEQCWQDYIFALPQGPLITVFGAAFGAVTARGDEMFAVMTRRSCAAIRELSAPGA